MGLDFLHVMTSKGPKGAQNAIPAFRIGPSKDLMIRGSTFYAIYDEETGLWSTDEFRAIEMIDREIDLYTKNHPDVIPSYLWDSSTGSIDKWHTFCNKQMVDNYHQLDDRITFYNETTTRNDYVSKKLPYSIEKAPIPAYNELISTLYLKEEREKIEWIIGSIVSGDSTWIQKFAVFYGASGTGKSTVLNIIESMFHGYCCTFEADALTSKNNQFSLEPFKNNPLIAIQQDGDLSYVETNARLNSLVSHEEVAVNEKFKTPYAQKFKCFLFMGTNKPVHITDTKSGLIRRLIDISPSGMKVPQKRYDELLKKIEFEYGGIAEHCLSFYKAHKHLYDNYRPISMLEASNDIYNFMQFYLDEIEKSGEEGVTAKTLYNMYKEYCNEFGVKHPYGFRAFKEELKGYFRECKGSILRGLKTSVFNVANESEEPVTEDIDDIETDNDNWLDFKEQHSILDDILKDQPAQYAFEETGKNMRKWENVTTKLSDLDTSKIHFVRVPENIIVIDFDIKNENGEKDFKKNLEAASFWPKTYAELSKSGGGIHLHYLYSGDVSKLSNYYADSIEIKVFRGGSSLRRMLTRCNNIELATINSGLPRREKGKVLNYDTIENEKHLRAIIKKTLRREMGLTPEQIAEGKKAHTKPSVEFIGYILNQAYDSKMVYDVDDLRPSVLQFASSSTNNDMYCVDLVSNMPFKSSDESFVPAESHHRKIVIFDTEVFPNLFLLNYKIVGDPEIHRYINPSPLEVAKLIENKDYDLVGFNCKNYDNHIMYARAYKGYSEMDLYKLSQRIIVEKDPRAKFSEAYNVSYTDIWDFATNKQSLKKWEVELGIHHKELGLPWDQPVPKEKWEEVSNYCDNDVIATEKVWLKLAGEFKARLILSDLVKSFRHIGACPNDSTNTLTKKLIFGKETEPQKDFNYRFLGEKPDHGTPMSHEEAKQIAIDIFQNVYKKSGNDLGAAIKYAQDKVVNDDLIPWWPGYEFHVEYGTNYDGESKVADIRSYADVIALLDTGIPVNSKITSEHKWSTYREYDGSVNIEIDKATGKKKKHRKVIGEGGLVFSAPGMYEGIKTQDSASHHPHSMYNEQIFGPEYTAIMWDLVRARLYIKHEDYESAGKLFNGALQPYLTSHDDAKDLSKALKIAINSIYGLTSARFPNEFRDNRNIDNIVAKRGALYMVDLKHFIEDLGFHVAHVKTDSIKVPDITDDLIALIRIHAALYGYEFETEEEYDRFCLVNDACYIARHPDGSWEAKGDEFLQKYTFKKLFTKEKITFEDLCVVKEVKKGAIYIETPKEGSDETDLKFVGRVGEFTPVREGGGALTCINEDKVGAVSGTKGYSWLESEFVRDLGENIDDLMNVIDMSYFEEMANATKEKLYVYGDYEWFVSDSPYIPPKYDESPWNIIAFPEYSDEKELA